MLMFNKCKQQQQQQRDASSEGGGEGREATFSFILGSKCFGCSGEPRKPAPSSGCRS